MNDVCMWTCVWLATPKRLMSLSLKSQVMFASAFSWIGDCFVFLGFILFTQRPLFTRRVHMHLKPAGGPHERRVRSLAIGWQAPKQCRGVTAGKPRHNSSNVRGVTAGKVRHNSSSPNQCKTDMFLGSLRKRLTFASKHLSEKVADRGAVDVFLRQQINDGNFCNAPQKCLFLLLIRQPGM